jgi:glycosyltransferase involved in cell wall biosynthesis
MNIDIIVPAYNERSHQTDDRRFLHHFGGRANIIVVVNGSNDATADVVRRTHA